MDQKERGIFVFLEKFRGCLLYPEEKENVFAQPDGQNGARSSLGMARPYEQSMSRAKLV